MRVTMEVEKYLPNGNNGWVVTATSALHGKKYLYGYDGRTKLSHRIMSENERLFARRCGLQTMNFMFEWEVK